MKQIKRLGKQNILLLLLLFCTVLPCRDSQYFAKSKTLNDQEMV